jgi:hypothetical protein
MRFILGNKIYDRNRIITYFCCVISRGFSGTVTVSLKSPFVFQNRIFIRQGYGGQDVIVLPIPSAIANLGEGKR